MKAIRPTLPSAERDLQFRLSLLNLMYVGSVDPSLASFTDQVIVMKQTLENLPASAVPLAAA